MAHLGNTVINGALKVLNGTSTDDLTVTRINGVTYGSKAAASGGTETSLCTTGEKYLWNNKINSSDNGAVVMKAIRGASQSSSTVGVWTCMLNSSQTGSPTCPSTGQWWHVISLDWSNDPKNWVSQLAVATQQNNGVWWRRNDSGVDISSAAWHRLAEGDTNGSATSVNGLTFSLVT